MKPRGILAQQDPTFPRPLLPPHSTNLPDLSPIPADFTPISSSQGVVGIQEQAWRGWKRVVSPVTPPLQPVRVSSGSGDAEDGF